MTAGDAARLEKVVEVCVHKITEKVGLIFISHM